MLFNSFLFLAFFAVLAVVYYILPHRFRWILLIAASLYYYAVFNLTYVFLLLLVALVTYVIGRAIGTASDTGRKKLLLTLGVLASLAPLIVFKYWDFFADSLEALLLGVGMPVQPKQFAPRLGLLLPVGLSFYTFSCISYIADVYSARLPAEKDPARYLLYVSFFPKLLAGPIERATTFLPQLARPISFNPENVTVGLQLILWGLFKKTVIADRLAAIVDAAYTTPSTSSPADLVIATYFFAFQIYCDFSGYTDIAIGAARVLGIDLMLNFRRPYLSTSIRDFWSHRWHISLATWFRDYMYFPLGGNRKGRWRSYFNQLAVFLVSGLWHGANWTFVIWGGMNGIYQVLAHMGQGTGERIGNSLRIPAAVGAVLASLLTFHMVLVTWVFFRAASITDAITVFTRVSQSLGVLGNLLPMQLARPEVLVSIALIVLLLVIELAEEKAAFWENLRLRPAYIRWPVYYALILGLIVFGIWGLRQFVYLQF